MLDGERTSTQVSGALIKQISDYPVLFVLAGANTLWLTAKKAVSMFVLAALLAGTIAPELRAAASFNSCELSVKYRLSQQ